MTPSSTGSSRPSGRAPDLALGVGGRGAAGAGPGSPPHAGPRLSVNRHFLCRHRGTTEGSAVCVFSMRDVQRAFNGFYKAVNRETLQWYTVAYEVPTPRPGSVSSAPCTGRGAREMGVSPRRGSLGFSKSVTAVFSSSKWGQKPRPACPTGLDGTMTVGCLPSCGEPVGWGRRAGGSPSEHSQHLCTCVLTVPPPGL